MRLLTAALLSLTLTACGQSGALYFAKPESAKPQNQVPASQQPTAPAKSADKDSIENSDTTTGP